MEPSFSTFQCNEAFLFGMCLTDIRKYTAKPMETWSPSSFLLRNAIIFLPQYNFLLKPPPRYTLINQGPFFVICSPEKPGNISGSPRHRCCWNTAGSKGPCGVTRCLEDHPRTNGSAVDLPSIVFVPLRDQVVNPFQVAFFKMAEINNYGLILITSGGQILHFTSLKLPCLAPENWPSRKETIPKLLGDCLVEIFGRTSYDKFVPNF